MYRVSKKSRTVKISQKLNISERNVSYNSCRVSNDLFIDLVSLTLGDVTDVTLIFLIGTPYFLLLQNLIDGIKSFQNTIINYY